METAQDPGPEPSRRSFLKKGILGGTLLALGAATLVAVRKGQSTPAPDRPLKALRVEAFPVLVAVAARVIPRREHAVDVAYGLDEALSYLPAPVQTDFGKIFGLLENGLAGLLTRGSATPFTLLDGPAQDKALEAWRDSRITILNGAYNALRKLSLGTYYADNDRAKEFGYPGPVFVKPEPPPIEPRGRISPPWVPAALRPAPELKK